MWAALLVFVSLSSAPIDGDGVEELISRGRASGQEGDFEAALGLFRQAYQQSVDPAIQCDIGLAYARLEKWAQAYLFLDSCRLEARDRAPGWSKTTLAEVRKALRRAEYAAVTFTSRPPNARVHLELFTNEDSFVTPRALYLPAGRHRLRVTHESYVAVDREIQVTAGEPLEVLVTLEPVAEKVIVTRAEPPPVEPAVGPVWGWVAGGTAAALAGAAVWFHVDAVDARDRAERLPAGAVFDRRLADFKRDRALALSGYALSALATGVAVYLLWPSDEP